MTRINAGIKSKEELARRILDGEELYLGEDRLSFQGNVSLSPFRIGRNYLHWHWNEYESVTKNAEWWERLDGSCKVLCLVASPISGGSFSTIRYIKGSSRLPAPGTPRVYHDEEDVSWFMAKPFTSDMLEVSLT